jgi:radical SAM protein with 4Fe4S-binding SPASM domain
MKTSERVNRITDIPPAYRNPVCPAPKSVKIELTGRCNFKCGFCAHVQRLRLVGEMNIALYTKLVWALVAAGVEELGVFYLGESFLCEWLPKAVSIAKEAGFKYVFLTTNGSLCTEDNLRAVMGAGLDSLKFSLNYASPEEFERIADVKSALFDNIARSVKLAHKVREEGGHKIVLAGSFIDYDASGDAAKTVYLEALRPYLDEIYGLPLYNQAALVEDPNWKFVQGNRGTLSALREPLPCWSIFTEGHIAFDGRLSACCFDHDNRFNMGDLTEVPFMEAWNSERFQELRRHHLEKNVDDTICEACVAFD